MITQAVNLIKKHRTKGVLIDSNLLLLLLVGTLDKNNIPKFKRTRNYRIEDFELLEQLLLLTKRFVTTPHIATEVCNLGNSFTGQSKIEFREELKKYVQVAKESNLPSRMVSRAPEHLTVGLPDAAITLLGRKRLVLTDDLELAVHIEKRGGKVINFNNLRAYV